jgi:hypothetical protein
MPPGYLGTIQYDFARRSRPVYLVMAGVMTACFVLRGFRIAVLAGFACLTVGLVRLWKRATRGQGVPSGVWEGLKDAQLGPFRLPEPRINPDSSMGQVRRGGQLSTNDAYPGAYLGSPERRRDTVVKAGRKRTPFAPVEIGPLLLSGHRPEAGGRRGRESLSRGSRAMARAAPEGLVSSSCR